MLVRLLPLVCLLLSNVLVAARAMLLQATVKGGGVRLLVDASCSPPRLFEGETESSAAAAALAAGLAQRSPAAGEEIIEWLADDSQSVICQVPRKLAIEHTLLHRGVGVVIYNSPRRDAVYVHQRSDSKRVFPGLYDMLVGGVSAPGEPSLDTLRRELSEEVGIELSAAGEECSYLGRCRVQTSFNFCEVACFELVCSEAQAAGIRFADGEVQWGEWCSLQRLKQEMLPKFEFVPDGLQVWDWMQREGKLLAL